MPYPLLLRKERGKGRRGRGHFTFLTPQMSFCSLHQPEKQKKLLIISHPQEKNKLNYNRR